MIIHIHSKIIGGEFGSNKNESTNEIIDRLQNHFSFLEKYLVWCNEEKQRVKFHNLPSPIKIGKNGFRVNNKNSKWSELFSEEEDLKESYRLVNKYFSAGKFKWTKHKNQAKNLISGLQQINNGIGEYKTDQ